jgi:DNA-binding NarL/FixJ family response regulator
MAQTQPNVRTLALTRHSDVAYLYRVLQAGARGYVLKQTAADALINAIRVVANGGTFIDPALADTLVEHSLNARDFDRKAAVGVSLTPRECEVLSLVAWGRSNKEIAAKLQISIKTVESYKATAVAKLHLRNRSEILRYALSRGWLRDDKAPD